MKFQEKALSLKHRKSLDEQESWKCYLLILPQLIGFFVFSLYPILWAAQKSFFFYDGVSINTRFTGMTNFITLFTRDATYWQTWITTIKFALCKLPIELVLSMGLALALCRTRTKFSGLFRTIYFLPHIISLALVVLVFSNIFEPFGYINTMLINMGIIDKPVEFLKTTVGGFSMMISADVWMNFGVNTLYFIAALSGVDKDIYEAADLDGCMGLKRFFKITLPLIAPMAQIICLLAIKGVLGTGEIVYLLTGGAPGGRTHTVNSYILQQYVPGFVVGLPNLGYGSAMCIVTSIITAAISLIYMKLSDKANSMY